MLLFLVWCYTPLRLYHGVSWARYQYYWAIYPDISRIANHENRSAKEWSHCYYCYLVFCMTRPWIEPATSRTEAVIRRLFWLQQHIGLYISLIHSFWTLTSRPSLKTFWQMEKLLVISFVYRSFRYFKRTCQHKHNWKKLIVNIYIVYKEVIMLVWN